MRWTAGRGLPRPSPFLVRWAPRLSVYATGIGIFIAMAFWWQLSTGGEPAVDARAYWSADPQALYPTGVNWRETGYLYSPAFELVVGWGRLVPLEVFVAI